MEAGRMKMRRGGESARTRHLKPGSLRAKIHQPTHDGPAFRCPVRLRSPLGTIPRVCVPGQGILRGLRLRVAIASFELDPSIPFLLKPAQRAGHIFNFIILKQADAGDASGSRG
jgi:hypothetical protein